MKTQEWKDCYAYRNIGIRGSNAKYETGMKELMYFMPVICEYLHVACLSLIKLKVLWVSESVQ